MSRPTAKQGTPPGELAIERDAFARLHYHILSHLDLGPDRADLYDPERPDRAWIQALDEAYRASADSELVQVLPLVLLGRSDRPPDAEQAVSYFREFGCARRLARAFERAYRAEKRRRREADELPERGASHDAEQTLEAFRGRLRDLRAKLWAKRDRSPPPLRIVDVPELETPGRWTRGRACTVRGRRWVAVSLRVPPERALIQILHEEIHPITDPVVQATVAESRPNADAIEGVAIDVGSALIEATAPELSDPYDEWRGRFSTHP